jgi:hypothetical protein
MRTVLKIGGCIFLFPDEVKASKALSLLAGAVQVEWDYSDGEVSYRLRDDDVQRELSMECLNKSVKIRGPRGEPIPEKAIKPARKALPSPRMLLLEDKR